ncbi:MAG: class III extradiol dioxygenase subunit B-like domain-containing protein [Actinomycetota bacterium]|nr:class III extradiol dioxygenase subunit B-like domain-containing protein [Actinomycetota bacterium]
MESLKLSCIVPHAPILIPEISMSERANHLIEKSSLALQKLSSIVEELKPDTIVLTYPSHLQLLREDCLTIESENNKRKASSRYPELEGVTITPSNQELVEEIIRIGSSMDLKMVIEEHRGEHDWGQLVPLYFTGSHSEHLISIPVAPYISLYDYYKLGIAIVNSAENLEITTIFVGSGDMSHRLTGSHYGHHPSGEKFDKAVVEIMKNAEFSKIFELDPLIVEEAGQDSIWSISTLAGTMNGYSVESDVLSYEAPFGIGYMVAVVSPRAPDEKRSMLV